MRKVTLLKKQIEKIIGFILHKQEQYREKHPDITNRMDHEIRYLMIVYDDFAQQLGRQLHDVSASHQEIAAGIIEITEQFSQEYNILKEHLKALDEEANAAVDGV